MKMRIREVFAVIFVVIALIDAAGNNYEYRVNYRISYQPRNSIRGRVRTSNRVRHSKDMSDSQLRTAILLGTVFGASSWKARSNFKHKEELPRLCYNDVYDMNQWGNVSFEGRFVCPTDDTMEDRESFCCGEEYQQHCCTFWGNNWRLAGVIIGIVVFVGFVFVLCFCIIKRRKGIEGVEGIEENECVVCCQQAITNEN